MWIRCFFHFLLSWNDGFGVLVLLVLVARLGGLLFIKYESQHPFKIGHCLRAFADSRPLWPLSSRIAHFPPRAELRFRFVFFQCFHTLSFREKSVLSLAASRESTGV